MFVCRACVKKWRGPAAQSLFAGRHAAPTSLSTVAWVTSTRARSLTTTRVARTAVEQETSATTLPEDRLRVFAVQEPTALEGKMDSTAVAGDDDKTGRDVMSSDVMSAEMQLNDDEDRMDPLDADYKTTNTKQMEARMRRRYKFLQDEYTIGETVNELVNDDRFAEALYLTRLASRDYKVAVSWNAVIRHLFERNRINDAVKMYQEMKKRGQIPNVRTYTTIFNGCALTVERAPVQALSVATKMYYSMMSDPRLRPNTIHMNAVLKVCARAKDLQAVFNIAKTANSTTRLPDSTTYTIILGAMRATTELPYDSRERKNKYKQSKFKKRNDVDDIGDPDLEKPAVTIRRARATWEEVVLNWRRGFVMMDEQLVCGMGRILLLGGVADKSSVFALLNQTMSIPRLDKTGDVSAKPKSAKLLAGPSPAKPTTQIRAEPEPQPPEPASPQREAESPVTATDAAAAAEDPVAPTEVVEDLVAATTSVDALIARTIDAIKLPVMAADAVGNVAALQNLRLAGVTEVIPDAVPDAVPDATPATSDTPSRPEMLAKLASLLAPATPASLEASPEDTLEAVLMGYTPGNTPHFKPEPRPKKPSQFAAVVPYDDQASSKTFAPKKTDGSLFRPAPENNTLSLLLEAIAGSRKTTLALPYWKLMTGDRYGIIPDMQNCHQLLRAIKRGRSSTEAVEALLMLPKFAYVGKTFRLAMEVCTYNTLNPNAFKSAGKILDLMNQTAILPDAGTLRLYLKVALTSNQHFKDAQTPEDAVAKKMAFGQQLVRALQRLWDPVRIVGNSVQAMQQTSLETAGARVTPQDRNAPEFKSMQAEYIDLLKLMVSATDMIVSENMADARTIKDMTTSRNLLNKQVTRFYSGQSPAVPMHPGRRRQLGAPYTARPEQRERPKNEW